MIIVNSRKTGWFTKHQEGNVGDRLAQGFFRKSRAGFRQGNMIRSSFIMAFLSAVISGTAKAAAMMPIALSLIWYIEQKGVESIVDAGFTFLQKRMFQGK